MKIGVRGKDGVKFSFKDFIHLEKACVGYFITLSTASIEVFEWWMGACRRDGCLLNEQQRTNKCTRTEKENKTIIRLKKRNEWKEERDLPRLPERQIRRPREGRVLFGTSLHGIYLQNIFFSNLYSNFISGSLIEKSSIDQWWWKRHLIITCRVRTETYMQNDSAHLFKNSGYSRKGFFFCVFLVFLFI